MNIPLLLLDIITLPITVIRLSLIYWFGARYNIPALEFLDVMSHAQSPYFNQQHINDNNVDTIDKDLRVSLYDSSRLWINNDQHVCEQVAPTNNTQPETLPQTISQTLMQPITHNNNTAKLAILLEQFKEQRELLRVSPGTSNKNNKINDNNDDILDETISDVEPMTPPIVSTLRL